MVLPVARWAVLALAAAIGFATAVALTMPGTRDEGYEGKVEAPDFVKAEPTAVENV